jgi:hypothetical protein
MNFRSIICFTCKAIFRDLPVIVLVAPLDGRPEEIVVALRRVWLFIRITLLFPFTAMSERCCVAGHARVGTAILALGGLVTGFGLRPLRSVFGDYLQSRYRAAAKAV